MTVGSIERKDGHDAMSLFTPLGIILLMLCVFYLWNESRTQWSWIVSLNTKIAKLQAESQVAEALDRQSEAIEELTRILEGE